MSSGAEVNLRQLERETYLRFAELCAQRRALQQKLHEVQLAMNELEPDLRVLLEGRPEGRRSVRMATGTIYLRRELWARPQPGCDQPQICAALRQNGLGHFVGEEYHRSRLSAHVRDLEKARRQLPEAVRKVLNVDPVYRVVFEAAT
jgi:hypothetical protein